MTQTPLPRSDWQARYGAKRRAIDRAILAEAERWALPEAPQKPQDAPIAFSASPYRPASKRLSVSPAEAKTMREAIARAFGRPLT